MRAGLDVARINMSHGTHAEHDRNIRLIRETADRVGRPLPILADLQGPKIRVGKLAKPLRLKDGEVVTIAPAGVAEGEEIPSTYDDLAKEVDSGTQVLLDDGLLELSCLDSDGVRARFEVVRGGVLASRKGINLPDLELRTASTTEKDLRDTEFALARDVEYVGLSFVRRARDVTDLRRRISDRAWIVAKIEKATALDELDEILYRTDAVMVARGDLGVELPFASVPLAQKRIIQSANGSGRPVITATQMLESMISYPRPTRAEVSDIANAVLDGTDAVMLSAETAVGKYPVKSVAAMAKIVDEIEASGVLEAGPRYLTEHGPVIRRGASTKEHAVARSSVNSARSLGAPAIIVITRSGSTARLVSSYRPPTPIFAVCTEAKVYRQLCGVWGVRPVLAYPDEITYRTLTDHGKRVIVANGTGGPGDPVVITSGLPFHRSGSTNTMTVEQL